MEADKLHLCPGTVQEGLEDEEEVKGTEEFKAAKGALEDVQSQLQSPLPNV